MKRSLFIIPLILSSLLCQAQLKAPVQTDTLYVASMKYHFEEIQPANWPFSYVVRTAGAFTFGNQSFRIKKSADYGGGYKQFTLVDAKGVESELKLRDEYEPCTIEFSDYIIEYTRDRAFRDTQEQRITQMTFRNGRALSATIDVSCALPGRSVVGTVPTPTCTESGDGVVAVDIWVDQYGAVTKAVAGAEGTTVTDTELWNESRNSALNTRFSMSADAPALQQGKITYTFTVKK